MTKGQTIKATNMITYFNEKSVMDVINAKTFIQTEHSMIKELKYLFEIERLTEE